MCSIEKTEQITTILANITIAVSVVVAALTYINQTNQAKKDVAIEFATRFNSGELLNSQRRVYIALSRANMNALDSVKVKRETLADIISNTVETSKNPSEIQLDIVTIISFLDETINCVNSGTCDEEVIRTSFGETAQRSACLFLPYAEQLKERYLLSGLGDLLRVFVDYEKTC